MRTLKPWIWFGLLVILLTVLYYLFAIALTMAI